LGAWQVLFIYLGGFVTLNSKNYIAIADWMVQDFDLNTKELLTYAIIYGFSQDGESSFSGSLSYLASWLGIRRDNVMRYLSSLVDKGLISKEKKTSSNKQWCEYKIVQDRGVVKTSDHIIISPWMIEDLQLKDKELILYALIYGFSRVGSDSFFTGNNAYMAKWLQIDKKNVSRYTSALIDKNLIERIDDGKFIKYRVISTKNNQNSSNNNPPQNEYTHLTTEEGEAPHFEYTPPQSEYRGHLNLSTNNLKENLNNNLNNINNNIDNDFDLVNNLTQEDFFVVVNEEIDKDELNSEEEKMFNNKLLSDKELYEKYKDSKIDIARIMKVYARNKLVDMTYVYKDEINEKGRDVTNLAEILLFKTLNLKKYSNKIDVINNLDNKQIFNLYKTACLLYTSNEEEKTHIRKTPEAYFIGVVDKVLEV
jgi:DNA-binding MarR family transcriptional regulator